MSEILSYINIYRVPLTVLAIHTRF